MEPDVSTVNIVEKASNSLQGVKFNLAMKIWKSIGVVIGRQMEDGRAVRIERFGTIGFNNTREPIFVLASEFAQANRVRGRSKQVLGSYPTAKLSMSHLAAETEMDRDLVKNVVDRVFLLLNQVVKKGKSVRMSFLPLGDFLCMDDVARFVFRKPFIQQLRDQEQKQIAKPKVMRPKSRGRQGSDYDTQSVQSQSLYSARSTYTMRPDSSRSTLSCKMSSRAESKHSEAPIPEFKLPLDVKSYYSCEDSPPKSIRKPLSVVDRVKQRIVSRGGSNGINAVSRVLRIMDDSGDKKLSKEELKYGLRDYGIDLNQRELTELMNYFDRDSDGVITFDEFLVALRGDMSDRRLDFVRQAFKLVDSTGDGIVTIEDLQDKYDVSQHPEVIARTKTKEEALREFLTQWDTGEKDGQVTLDEFIEYYRNVSASIDEDDYFELMMRNAWYISGGEGQCANSSNRRVLVQHADGKETVEEITDDLGIQTRAEMKENLKARGIRGDKIAMYGSIDSESKQEDDELEMLRAILYDPPVSMEVLTQRIGANRVMSDGCERISTQVFARTLMNLSRTLNRSTALRLANSVRYNGKSNYIDCNDLLKRFEDRFGKRSHSNGSVIDRVRAKILARGGRTGFNGLQRSMRIMDDNGDKKLSKQELKSGLSDFGVDINFQELDHIMSYFDLDRNGSISFDEFLIGMRGEMNERRLGFVRQAFQLLDKTQDGVVTLADIRLAYDVSQHPDVISGKLTEKEALTKFMSMWDTDIKDGIVTLNEFETYYKNISASIDGDDYFELMMRNAWHISGGSGQCANTSNRRVLVIEKDGTERVEQVENDLGIKKSDTKKIRENLKARGIQGKIEISDKKRENGKKKPNRSSTSSVRSNNGSKVSTPRSVSRVEEESVVALDSKGRPIRKELVERHKAAQLLQSNFRGHKDRRLVDTVRRKQIAQAKLQEELQREKESNRKRVARPALRSTHGF